MDDDLLSAFLTTLKETNTTLLELVKITAHNQLAIKIIGVTISVLGIGFVTWMFTHFDSIIKVTK